MTDLARIPLEKLHTGKQECIEDIALCLELTASGIETYDDDQGVQERLYCNRAIIVLIDEELAHRKEKQE